MFKAEKKMLEDIYKIDVQEKFLLPPILQILSLISLVKGLLSDILNSYLFISFRYRLSVGTNEKIQLSSLIAAFQVTRDLIVTEA